MFCYRLLLYLKYNNIKVCCYIYVFQNVFIARVNNSWRYIHSKLFAECLLCTGSFASCQVAYHRQNQSQPLFSRSSSHVESHVELHVVHGTHVGETKANCRHNILLSSWENWLTWHFMDGSLPRLLDFTL